MRVQCPSCRQPIPADDVNLATALAKCSRCDAVFDVRAHLPGAPSARRERPDVGLPKGLVVDESEVDLVIRRRWFGALAIALTVFAIFWDGFLFVWFSIAISQGAWVMAAFGSIHAIVGLVLTYFVAALYVNTTTIRAGHGALQVTHAPLPWFGRRSLARDEVDQIFCKERVRRGRNGASTSYEVHVVKNDGTRTKLVSGLPSDEQAFYIEQELERHLGIANRPVRGELAG